MTKLLFIYSKVNPGQLLQNNSSVHGNFNSPCPPPEELHGATFDPYIADLWNVGVVLFQLLFGPHSTPKLMSTGPKPVDNAVADVQGSYVEKTSADAEGNSQPEPILYDLCLRLLSMNPRKVN
jgi:hypothetical protein